MSCSPFVSPLLCSLVKLALLTLGSWSQGAEGSQVGGSDVQEPMSAKLNSLDNKAFKDMNVKANLSLKFQS